MEALCITEIQDLLKPLSVQSQVELMASWLLQSQLVAFEYFISVYPAQHYSHDAFIGYLSLYIYMWQGGAGGN